MRTVIASGADARYGDWLLNLVGSLHANAHTDAEIVLYDLGLSPSQRRLAGAIRGAELRRVPPFSPHWALGRTWKTWIWTHTDADVLVWLDAGLSVLRPLAPLLDAIDRDGYFVVSQGVANRLCTPSDYVREYELDDEQLARPSVAAGILGFRTHGRFYDEVVVPTHRDALDGRSLGASAGEVDAYTRGLERTDDVIVRDCPHFRHEQTLLNVHLVRAYADPVVHDLDRFAGWRSRRDHPEQVIWSHRRRGDLAWLTSVPYEPRAWLRGKGWGAWNRGRWWVRNHSWLFRPRTYLRKAAGLAGGRPGR